MNEDNVPGTQSQPESHERLSAPAIARYMNQAHHMLARYCKERFEVDIKDKHAKLKVPGQVWRILEAWDGRLANLGTISDKDEQRKAMGALALPHLNEICDGLICAYLFATIAATYDNKLSQLLDGETLEKTDPQLTKDNLAALAHGLNAALIELGAACATEHKARAEATPGLQIAPPSLMGYRLGWGGMSLRQSFGNWFQKIYDLRAPDYSYFPVTIDMVKAFMSGYRTVLPHSDRIAPHSTNEPARG